MLPELLSTEIGSKILFGLTTTDISLKGAAIFILGCENVRNKRPCSTYRYLSSLYKNTNLLICDYCLESSVLCRSFNLVPREQICKYGFPDQRPKTWWKIGPRAGLGIFFVLLNCTHHVFTLIVNTIKPDYNK